MSEKTAVNEIRPLLASRPRVPPRQRLTVVVILSLVTVGSLLANFYWYPTHLLSSPGVNDETKEWSWSNLKPRKTLEWKSCYDGEFECARLDVPMDWQEPSDDKRVVLGVIKLAAKTDGPKVPPLFINPGGPGGSGITALRRLGPSVQKVAGDYHDVISWDPRGVGISTPRLDCWASFQKREMWKLQNTPVVDERPGLIYDAYSKAAAFSGACETALNETDILRHVGTASIARDMLELVEQTGHSKLRYWGFSYGTILGGVFASTYPDRVDRLVSDGNVNYESWFKGDRSEAVSDADRILDTFDEACHNAGPEKCELWASSSEAVRDRRDNLLKSLKARPVLVPSWATESGPEMPFLVTYSVVQMLTRSWIYKPLQHANQMARMYATLETGDGLPTYGFLREMEEAEESMSKLMCSIADVPATEPQDALGMEPDAFPGIMCSDSMPVDDTPEEMEQYVEKMAGLSKWSGVAHIPFRLVCVGRTVRPKWQFTLQSEGKIETSTPILFLNNIYDNVTPIASARNNSAHFTESGFLQQNSLGHCTFSAPSTCTARHVNAYFRNATLPPEGTKCDQDYDLFEDPDESFVLAQDELSSAVWDMSRNAYVGFGSLTAY